MKLLHIQVSPDLAGSASRSASARLVEKLRVQHHGLEETVLDLAQHPLPHLDAFTIGAFFTRPEDRNDAQRAAIQTSEKMVDQLFACDTLVISSPMWNLGLPSVLKAWFDHITRAGHTFAFTPEGTKVGLVSGKKVYSVVASGSVFAHGPFVQDDQFTPYIRVALEYIGITDVEFIRVDGTHDPVSRDTALPRALQAIDRLF
ncbi:MULTISPECIES: FMN-dependent NADH-azoreductase [unclassified Pantoea]|uniref:FMN-dependent NADH-azoreductase n=1 Tax=unclassified Pantoea TaxID=2630326 RepID=UPI001CD28216|nr:MULTISPECIES: NAD(P)H-dependent oxidoreductase [unclassified Pantoea]MCA1176997.1 NAD(P)H-dependent oxidoreductase [Pantoea sp. alder69]MCA1252124.1 NAD(P)H-dependent oxidoreductase [Pantoea sp. alder70]MCA1265402.1 NAD(P)H-dependent oxidoreductase [Pantoea sp. alder81]